MNKTFNAAKELAYRAAQKGAAVVTVIGATIGSAQAALDPAMATSLTAVQGDAVSIAALVVPVVIAVFGLTLAPKLFKRFGRSI